MWWWQESHKLLIIIISVFKMTEGGRLPLAKFCVQQCLPADDRARFHPVAQNRLDLTSGVGAAPESHPDHSSGSSITDPRLCTWTGQPADGTVNIAKLTVSRTPARCGKVLDALMRARRGLESSEAAIRARIGRRAVQYRLQRPIKSAQVRPV